MIELTPLEDFKNFEGMSYSRLSKLADSPQAYRASLADDKKSPAMSLGSAVDLKLTDPENFSKEVYVMSTDKPKSEMMQLFCDVYADTGDKQAAFESSGYSISYDRVVKKFEEEGRDYYDAIMQAKGKSIIDIEQMFKVNHIVFQLKDNPFTKKYFEQRPGYEVWFQSPITWEEDIVTLDNPERTINIPFKGVVDIIEIDHDHQIITPIDLKTGEESFRKGFFKFKRYLQAAMYYQGIVINNTNGYKVANPKFIYADTNLLYPPAIYTMTDHDVEVGIEGKKFTVLLGNGDDKRFQQYKYKGYRRLAAEMDWHNRMDQWQYSYDVYQANGEIEIDAFNLIF